MTDIVEQLRTGADCHLAEERAFTAGVMAEAADEIERLATEFQKMTDHLFNARRDALEEAAKVLDCYEPRCDGLLSEIAAAIRALKEQP
jgi:CHASE3 domain sensor protein